MKRFPLIRVVGNLDVDHGPSTVILTLRNQVRLNFHVPRHGRFWLVEHGCRCEKFGTGD